MILDFGYIPLVLLCTGLFGLVIRLKRKDKQLREALASLVSAALMKDEFLAVMSHELRTPLTAVIGYSELMLEGIGGEPTEEQKDMLERIGTSSKHLMTLIQQVLDLSRAQHGRLIANPTRVDVKTLTAHTAMITGANATRKGLQFFVNVPNDPIFCETDSGKFRQILLNLIGNAIKFTENGSVTIQLRATDQHLVLSIRDTGIGIPLDLQDRIFEPFFRVDGGLTRRRDGAGLGLAITHELVDLLEGTIKVKSTPGEGSEFEVRLPRRARDFILPVEETSTAPEAADQHKLELVVPLRDGAGRGDAEPTLAEVGQLERDGGSYDTLTPDVGLRANLAS